MQPRAPSGLFPTRPTRPAFREPHPVRVGSIVAGVAVGVAWLLLVGLMATTMRGYIWLTTLAAALAWLVALGLARAGDRGVAVGVALAACTGMSVAAAMLVVRWASVGFPLW